MTTRLQLLLNHQHDSNLCLQIIYYQSISKEERIEDPTRTRTKGKINNGTRPRPTTRLRHVLQLDHSINVKLMFWQYDTERMLEVLWNEISIYYTSHAPRRIIQSKALRLFKLRASFEFRASHEHPNRDKNARTFNSPKVNKNVSIYPRKLDS